ncbi:MAG TPA: helix-turn-helix domain-containing protein [Pirellulales bacterium]|nr:helix-turn-helix domain-containing protein [Pirellulales bacterium]
MNSGSVKSVKKLTCDERRAAIIDAVRRVFAEKGFDGTTTRELAAAAGVSEALLFKHFPNKEALYSAMQISCCNERDVDRIEQLKALEPSASTLVLLVHFFVSRVLVEPECNPEKAIHARLMLRSLTENGEFVRLCLKGLPSELNQWMAASLQAAVAAGDAYDGPVQPSLGCWLTHHLAMMIKAYKLPTTPVMDYKLPGEKVVEQTVWYTLRGMGLKDEAIRRYYNPRALALFAE